MANFDFKNLIMINPCKLDDECYARAMHAQNILKNSKTYKSFKQATKNIDFLVATSSIDSENEKKHLRNSILINNFSKKIHDLEGNIGIIFGREDYGLYNNEISKCDMLVKIPTSEKYKSMNLSHAVSIVLYSLFIEKFKEKEKKQINKIEKEKLYTYFSELLNQINYPEHKKEKTQIMFKRLIARAMPSKWEYHSLMGVISKSIEKNK